MAPTLSDGAIVLNAHTDADIPAHLAGEGGTDMIRYRACLRP